MPHYYFDMVVTEMTHVRRVMIFSGSLRLCSEFLPPHHFYHNEFSHSSQLQEYHTAFCLLSIFHSILLSNTTRGYVLIEHLPPLKKTLLIYSFQIYSRSLLAQIPRKPSCLGHYLIYSKSPEGLRSAASLPIR